MKNRLVLVWLACMAAPASLLALGIRIPDQDTFAIARANAFVATADNPSAIFYNPAGITQLEGLNSRSGAYIISLGSEYTSPTGVKAETKDRIQPVPQFFGTYSLKDAPVSLGLGVYSPFGLALEWPDNTNFRRLARKGRITYISLNPVLAWKISETVSVGGGATFNWAEASLSRGIAVPGDEFKFKGDDIDFGFNAGFLWQLHPKHSFGFNYLSKTRMEFDGHVTLKPLGQRLDAVTTPFEFPQHLVVGYSFRPTPAWNFEFNADWTDWDALNTVTLKPALLPPQDLHFNWESSWMYEWGATRYFDNGLAVSAGYMFSENSVPDAWFNPSVPDSDRHIFGLGVGGQYRRMNWDAAYQFAYGPSRTVTGSYPAPLGSPADGKYCFISHAFALSLGFTF